MENINSLLFSQPSSWVQSNVISVWIVELHQFKMAGKRFLKCDDSLVKAEKSACRKTYKEKGSESFTIFLFIQDGSIVEGVTRVYVPWFFVSSQQRFGVMDIKPPQRVTALGSWTDLIIGLRSRTDHVIALRQISITVQCYSSILFRR